MNRIRLWFLRRHYRRIALLEAMLDYPPAAIELRVRFAQQSVQAIDRSLVRKGWSRQRRREMKRRAVAL